MPDPEPGGPRRGDLVELDIGAPAHGGHCVARLGRRVIFVRHALPGERVRALITEDAGRSFWRADAVEVLTASPDRVEAPCPHAGPGRCGGCDWQHAAGEAQRALKAAVVRDQLARLARLDVEPTVERLPGGLLGWRTRVTYAAGPDGVTGLRRHRSHEVEALERCPLGVPGVGDGPVLERTWPGLLGIEAVAGEDGAVTLLAHRPGPGRHARGRRPLDRVEVVDGPARVRHTVAGRAFDVDAGGFWQVHPAAAETFATALLEMLGPRPGEAVLDLYAGAGVFTALLADAVGADGLVLGVESTRQAVADAMGNLADLPQARMLRARVGAELLRSLHGRPDLVVLDPPRAGAGADVMAAIFELTPRAVAYVACDPAALARDIAAAVRAHWRLARLRAFDAFPMTHHVECIALLVPADAEGAPSGHVP